MCVRESFVFSHIIYRAIFICCTPCYTLYVKGLLTFGQCTIFIAMMMVNGGATKSTFIQTWPHTMEKDMTNGKRNSNTAIAWSPSTLSEKRVRQRNREPNRQKGLHKFIFIACIVYIHSYLIERKRATQIIFVDLSVCKWRWIEEKTTQTYTLHTSNGGEKTMVRVGSLVQYDDNHLRCFYTMVVT